MKRRILLGLVAMTLAAPFTLAGCFERTEERVEIERDVPAGDSGTVIVPESDRDVDVDIDTRTTQPAPGTVEQRTETNSTTVETESR